MEEITVIIISACLVGINCSYCSQNAEHPDAVKLVMEGKAIPICPEQLGGLNTPREPAEINNGRILTVSGVDITEAFLRGADETLKVCRKFSCKKAILKSRSPSCGVGMIYDGNFNGTLVKGNGVTADLLIKNGINVTSSDALQKMTDPFTTD